MILQNLGDGLALRRATAADTEELAAFNAKMQADPGESVDATICAWTRDLMEGQRPVVGPDDFTIVEDTRTGAIVSSLRLISQTWAYDGIAFPVGQIEIVSTHPDYRRRGFIRKQIERVHHWSQARGELVQAISGIPWYYRQFGYEMALDNTSGRSVYATDLPSQSGGEQEPVRVRPASAADLEFLQGLDAPARRHSFVACVRDAALWRHEIDGRRELSTRHLDLLIAETPDGTRLGYVARYPLRLRPSFVSALELAPGVSWLATIPALLRALFADANTELRAAGSPPAERLDLRLGTDHPAYRAIPDLAAHAFRGGAWYIRVPDLPSFLRRIAPVLESRLATSDAAGFSGEFKLSFYRSGVRLHLLKGRIESVEAWSRPERWEADTLFPDLTFLQILFGYRSFADLEHAFPDCDARTDTGHALVETLFLKRASRVWEAT
jgi:GNAT superfamily N-acetyltransferase